VGDPKPFPDQKESPSDPVGRQGSVSRLGAWSANAAARMGPATYSWRLTLVPRDGSLEKLDVLVVARPLFLLYGAIRGWRTTSEMGHQAQNSN
jgi:hypothetical protein